MPGRPSEFARPQLESAVQKMLDAGFPDEEVAQFVKDFDTNYATLGYPQADAQSAEMNMPARQDVFAQSAGQNLTDAAVGAGKHVYDTAKGVVSGLMPWNWSESLESATAARRAAGAKAATAQSLPEKVGYTIAGKVPFLGPLMAQAGEALGSGNAEQMGAGAVDAAMAVGMGKGAGRLTEKVTGPLGSPGVNAAIDQAAQLPRQAATAVAGKAIDATKAVATNPTVQKIGRVAVPAAVGYLEGGPKGALIGAMGGGVLNKGLSIFDQIMKQRAGTAPAPAPATPVSTPAAAATTTANPAGSPATFQNLAQQMEQPPIDWNITDATPLTRKPGIIRADESLRGLVNETRAAAKPGAVITPEMEEALRAMSQRLNHIGPNKRSSTNRH